MAIRISCPGCQTSFTVAESLCGQTVRCTTCQQVFRVGQLKKQGEVSGGLLLDEAPAESPPPNLQLTDKPATPARDTTANDFDLGGISAPNSDGQPARPARATQPRRDEDDGPQRPRSPSGKGLVVGSIVAAIILTVGGIVIWAVANRPKPAAPVAADKKKVVDPAPPPIGPPPDPVIPKPPDLPPIRPPDPQPAAMKKKAVLPLSGPGPTIDPPPVPGQGSVTLRGAEIEDVAVGGNGRYLALAAGRRVHVFDVSAGRVVHELDPGLVGGRLRVAAGMHKLIVASQGSGVFNRYDLATGQLDNQSGILEAGQLTDVVMGSASSGPLLVTFPEAKSLLLDPNDWSTVEPDWDRAAMPSISPLSARASADGRTFTGRVTGAGRLPNVGVLLSGERGYLSGKTEPGAYTVPLSPDGQRFFVLGKLATINFDPLPEQPPSAGPTRPTLPAVHGDYYLQLEINDPSSRTNTLGKVHFFLSGMVKPFGRLDNVEGVHHRVVGLPRLLPEQRVFFVPAAKTLVTVVHSPPKVNFYRFDAEAELEKSNLDHLGVVSVPPRTARKGARFEYAVRVKSSQGDVKYRLEWAPQSMTVGADGIIRWDVPAMGPATDVGVRLKVTNGGGREHEHRFRLELTER